MVVVFDAELWLWEARRVDRRTFVTLPPDVFDEIHGRTAWSRGGFGSVRVRATIGGTTWTTSIFPDSPNGVYVLPVNQKVRRAEALDVGDLASVTVELIDP